MKAEELRQKSDQEIREHLQALFREQFSLRMQRGVGQLTRPSQMRRVRKDIARAKTILTEKTRRMQAGGNQ